MSKRSDIDYLTDIRESIERIETYIGTMSYEGFLKDEKSQDAIVRNIEILGEAAKNISMDFKNRYPQIPWKELAGARNRLIHQYFGVNYDIVWDIIKNNLPLVAQEIDKTLI